MNSAPFNAALGMLRKSRSDALEHFTKLDAAVVALGAAGMRRVHVAEEEALLDLACYAILGVLSERRMRERDIEDVLTSFGLPSDRPFVGRVLKHDERIIHGKQGWWSTSIITGRDPKAKPKETS